MTDINMKKSMDVVFEENDGFTFEKVKDGVYILADMDECNPSDVAILPNYSIRVKDFVFEFGSKSGMETELPGVLMGGEWITADKSISDDCFTFIRSADDNDYASSCKTMAEALKDGIDFVLQDGSFFGNDIKYINKNVAPVFVMAAYGMEDSLYYAHVDHPNAGKDELFDYYLAKFGMPWWFNLVGFEGFFELVSYYFDRQYPRMLEREKQKAK